MVKTQQSHSREEKPPAELKHFQFQKIFEKI